MGSDFPIEEPNPILGLVAGGESRDTVLHGFTSGAAYASFEESRAGRIAPGFRADLSAFDRDVLCEPPEKLKDARAIMTMVAGEWA
jgi:predicted amidohydrolase YtcJ